MKRFDIRSPNQMLMPFTHQIVEAIVDETHIDLIMPFYPKCGNLCGKMVDHSLELSESRIHEMLSQLAFGNLDDAPPWSHPQGHSVVQCVVPRR